MLSCRASHDRILSLHQKSYEYHPIHVARQKHRNSLSITNEVVLVSLGWKPRADTVPSSRHEDTMTGTSGNLPARIVSNMLCLTRLPPRLVMLPCQAAELFVSVLTSVIARHATAAEMFSAGHPQALAYSSTRSSLNAGRGDMYGAVLRYHQGGRNCRDSFANLVGELMIQAARKRSSSVHRNCCIVDSPPALWPPRGPGKSI